MINKLKDYFNNHPKLYKGILISLCILLMLDMFAFLIPIAVNASYIDGTSYGYSIDFYSHEETISSTGADVRIYSRIGSMADMMSSEAYIYDLGDLKTYYFNGSDFISTNSLCRYYALVSCPSSYNISVLSGRFDIYHSDPALSIHYTSAGITSQNPTPVNSNNPLAVTIANQYGINLSDSSRKYYLYYADIDGALQYADIDLYASHTLLYTLVPSTDNPPVNPPIPGETSFNAREYYSNYYNNYYAVMYNNKIQEYARTIQATVNQTALDNAYARGKSDGQSETFTFSSFFTGIGNGIISPFITLANNIQVGQYSLWFFISLLIILAIIIVIVRILK